MHLNDKIVLVLVKSCLDCGEEVLVLVKSCLDCGEEVLILVKSCLDCGLGLDIKLLFRSLVTVERFYSQHLFSVCCNLIQFY